VFLLNSRLGRFTAAPSGSVNSPEANHFTLPGHPFSRSYGANLPSSLARVLSSALGFSPDPPVSVSGTVTHWLARGFSWQRGFDHFRPCGHVFASQGEWPADLPADPPTGLNHLFQQVAGLPNCVSPLLVTPPGGTGIFTRCPSPTPFGLGLGTD
jgi:hypothetical protein